MTKEDFCSVLILISLAAFVGYQPVSFAEQKAPAAEQMPGTTRMATVPITLGGKTIRANVADTDFLLRTGLLEHKTISDDEGMLLFFQLPGEYAIHMEGMKFPIDAIWIDDKDEIKLVYESIPPNSGVTYPSLFRCKYCLEVKAGFCKRFGIKAGQTVKFGVPGN
jgi:uncharacterized protein